MGKYPISKEFFPYSCFAPPIRNAKMAGVMGVCMRAPKWIWHDDQVHVTRECIEGFHGGEVEVLIFTPQGIAESLPCLVYYHGGGFFFGAAGYHYKLAKAYALETPCKVVFVQYRLAPKHPFPVPPEDCYRGYLWTMDNAERLGIDKVRIAVGGDSAGGALAATVAQMARDRNVRKPWFQLLVYPVTDRRMQSDSSRRFTDTPLWNSELSKKMWAGYIADEHATDIAYASPIEAKNFADLPDAYIETAEFDCLHDDGIGYAEKLHAAGTAVELHETQGTMHGFDIVEKAPTAKAAVAARIRYMQKKLYGERADKNDL